MMRLLRSSGGVPDLPELGLRGLGLKRVEEAILKPTALLLFAARLVRENNHPIRHYRINNPG